VGDLRPELPACAPRGHHQALLVAAGEALRQRPRGNFDAAHSLDSLSARSAYPSTLLWRWRAIPSAPSGTSSVMTDPAPVYALAPTRTGATKAVSTPVFTSSPITVRCLRRPSQFAVMFPAAMCARSPMSS